ncbi:pentapeptide repeat-containing protein [Nocardiopsis sp. B62]|uniref:pentapeptide repeat-containing protein n=1 Tax=Nocardiopsis sp. B62 TaxID=2824874 RepID=UPI001B3685DF|nr:pentapeptide repeat-containing protein [Nocardiopsis sp. B62]MBQ1081818.1 pentapeptide repeat-containing protein [Nocardiopsis sp. B62]
MAIALVSYSAFSKKEKIIDWIKNAEHDAILFALGVMILMVCLTRAPERSHSNEIRIISWSWFVLGFFVVAASTWIATSWLLAEAADGQRIEAIRTGLTIGAGTGGAMALIISARRQWLGERSHLHDMAVSRNNLKDAQEKRVTELQANASDQISSESPAARLSGLYTLERLAQNNPEYRQTITNIICAYLRMASSSTNDTQKEGQNSDFFPAISQEEREVRLTAQEILSNHLRPIQENDSKSYWPNISLDLSRANLVDFNLDGCELNKLTCRNANFQGSSSFRRAKIEFADFSHSTFSQSAHFEQSKFSQIATFDSTNFEGGCHFESAIFSDKTSFSRSRFSRSADFTDSSFRGSANFSLSKMRGSAQFYRCKFNQGADFGAAHLNRLAVFQECVFGGYTTFGSATFREGADFESSRFLEVTSFKGSVFGSDALFSGVSFLKYSSFKNMKVKFFGVFEGSKFNRTSFNDSRFGCTVNFSRSHFSGDVNLSAIKCGWPPMLEGAEVTKSNGQRWPNEWVVVWDKEDLGHFEKAPDISSKVAEKEER